MLTRLSLGLILISFAGPAIAQTSSTTTTTTTAAPASTNAATDNSIAAQQAAIQAQITQGITSGALSQAQIAALQAQQDRLSSGLGQVGAGRGETITPIANPAAGAGINGNLFHQTGPAAARAPTTTQTQTGPDPFTYNSLGPDAYQAQKYQNPAYNVPAYPTTNPQPADVQQQYSGPSAGAPYGAGYGQAPGAGGSGVYVYHPSMSR